MTDEMWVLVELFCSLIASGLAGFGIGLSFNPSGRWKRIGITLALLSIPFYLLMAYAMTMVLEEVDTLWLKFLGLLIGGPLIGVLAGLALRAHEKRLAEQHQG